MSSHHSIVSRALVTITLRLKLTRRKSPSDFASLVVTLVSLG
jgi:hypothetical protein